MAKESPRTAWVLQFYDDVTFIAWIAEKERLPDPG
jgi:hypothetical protein